MRSSSVGRGARERALGEWRLIVTEPAPGAWNMAVDEALMESVRAGAPPALRLYRWSPPCLSLGRNQPGAGRYDVARLRALGVDVVRRPTGGRAVLHDAEVTYSVAAPDRLLGTARTAYRAINRVLADGLAALGADVVVHAASGRAPVPSTAPCFAEPVAGEVTFSGRKIVGSAQIRRSGVLLQHGSIPLRPSDVARDLEAAGLLPPDRAANVEAATGVEATFEAVADSLRHAWAGAIGPCVPALLDPDEIARARAAVDRYRDDAWTWRA